MRTKTAPAPISHADALAIARAALGAVRSPAAPARPTTRDEALRIARAALGAPAVPAPARPTTVAERKRVAGEALRTPGATADEAMAAALAALGVKPTAAERKPRAPRKARMAKPVTTAALRFPLAYPCNDAACSDGDRHPIGSAGCAWLEAPTAWGRVRKDRCGAYSEAPGCTYRREHRPGGSKRCRFAHERGDGHVSWRDAEAMGDGDTPADALVRRLTPGVVVEYGLNGRGPSRRLFVTDVERVDDMVRVAGVALDARWFPVRRDAVRLSAASDVIVHAEDEYVRAAAEAHLATPGLR